VRAPGSGEATEILASVNEDLDKPENENLYTPNDRLVDILHDGLIASYEIVRARAEKADEIRIPSREYSQSLLAPRVFEVIASRARRIALGMAENRPLVSGNRFDYEIVVEICANVPIRLDDATIFFKLLREDMVSWLRRGGKIGGNWGSLVLTENEIRFETAEPEPQLAGDWEKPSDFKWR
jgi:hypothetical protein